MMDISPDKLAAADRRITSIEQQVDRLLWHWRNLSHKCPGGACRVQDRTRDTITFCENLVEGFVNVDVADLCEIIAVAVRRLKDVTPVVPPEHQWIATEGTNANCSCGETFEASDRAAAEQAWTDHAGDGGLVMPWYAQAGHE
jgi:hypothetical protein